MDPIGEAPRTIIREAIVHGVLKPDGSLVLDRAIDLPPGEVSVIIRSVVPTSSDASAWLARMRKIRDEINASGFQGNTDIELDIKALRSDEEYDRKIASIEAETMNPARAGAER